MITEKELRYIGLTHDQVSDVLDLIEEKGFTKTTLEVAFNAGMAFGNSIEDVININWNPNTSRS